MTCTCTPDDLTAALAGAVGTDWHQHDCSTEPTANNDLTDVLTHALTKENNHV